MLRKSDLVLLRGPYWVLGIEFGLTIISQEPTHCTISLVHVFFPFEIINSWNIDIRRTKEPLT